MASTTPAAIFGDRLRQARAMRELSLRALGEVMQGKVSHTTLAQFEKGERIPGSDVLLALCGALGQKPEFFFRPVSVQLEQIDFRKTSKLGKKKIEGIREAAAAHFERYLEVEELCGERREFHPPSGLHPITSLDGAEHAASQVRSAWKLGHDPIPGVLELLEEHGVKIHLMEGPQEFNGFSGWTDGIPVVVLNKIFPADRLRFTALHELAHLILKIDEGLDEEKACHRFAGSFLFPADACKAELHSRRSELSVPELQILKRRWGVSMGAIAKRAEQLGIVSGPTYKAFVMRTSAQGWRRREPGEVVPETTDRFDRLLFRAVAEGYVTLSKAAELSGRSLEELRGRLQGA